MSREPAPSASVQAAQPTNTLHRCRACGCLWRYWLANETWSLADATQRPCSRCDNSPEFFSLLDPPAPARPAHGELARRLGAACDCGGSQFESCLYCEAAAALTAAEERIAALQSGAERYWEARWREADAAPTAARAAHVGTIAELSRAAYQAARAEAMEWRTIETAPKDGAAVLLWSEAWEGTYGVVIGRYSPRHGRNRAGWCCPEFSTRDWAENEQPTHWMPRPNPPIADQDAPPARPAQGELARTELQRIVDHYDMRSELYTGDAELAAGLANIARAALAASKGSGGE